MPWDWYCFLWTIFVLSVLSVMFLVRNEAGKGRVQVLWSFKFLNTEIVRKHSFSLYQMKLLGNTHFIVPSFLVLQLSLILDRICSCKKLLFMGDLEVANSFQLRFYFTNYLGYGSHTTLSRPISIFHLTGHDDWLRAGHVTNQLPWASR